MFSVVDVVDPVVIICADVGVNPEIAAAVVVVVMVVMAVL